MNFLNRSKKQNQDKEISELTKFIETNFAKFEKSSMNRLVLAVEPVSEDDREFYQEMVPKGWNSVKENMHDYFPANTLDERERKFINNTQEYQTITFVKEIIPGIRTIPEAGIEIYTRIRSGALLPKLNKESNLNYSSISTVFSKEDFKDVAKLSIEDDINLREVIENFKIGANQYNKVSGQLFKKAGVYDSLKILEKRNQPANEELFKEIRKSIYSAK